MMQFTRATLGRMSLLLLVGTAAQLTGCTHENPLSLELEGNLAMIRLPGAGAGVTGQCLPQGETQFRPTGVFDLMVTNRYEFFPRIENKLPETQAISGMGPESLRLDASTVTVEGAAMTLELDTTSPGPLKVTGALKWRTSWYTPFVAQIEAGQFVGSAFTLIPSDVGQLMKKQFGDFADRRTARQQAVVKVRLIGRMADGTTVESNTIAYPVDLCWGCLVSLPVSIPGVGVDPALQYLACSSKSIGAFTPPCMPGNDEYLPCQFYCAMCDLDNTCDDAVCPTP
mgnify:FL=1